MPDKGHGDENSHEVMDWRKKSFDPAAKRQPGDWRRWNRMPNGNETGPSPDSLVSKPLISHEVPNWLEKRVRELFDRITFIPTSRNAAYHPANKAVATHCDTARE